MSGAEAPKFPRTRRTLPVIVPTEWIQFHPEHAVIVAEWLAERGVRCELAFVSGQRPTLWRGTALDRDTVKTGQWVGVQMPGHCYVVDDGVLDDVTRYRNTAAWPDGDEAQS